MTKAARALWGLSVLLLLIVAGWVALGLVVRGVVELFLMGWGLLS